MYFAKTLPGFFLESLSYLCILKLSINRSELVTIIVCGPINYERELVIGVQEMGLKCFSKENVCRNENLSRAGGIKSYLPADSSAYFGWGSKFFM